MAHKPVVITDETQQLIRKVRWYIKLRWFYVLGLSIPGLTSLYVSNGASPTFRRSFLIAAAGLAYNGIFFVLARRSRGGHNYFKTLGWVQITSDIILTTSLIISGGGVESRAIVVYAIGIIISGAMFGSRATYITALTCVALYDVVILLDWKGVIRSGDITAPQLHGDGGYALTTIAFYSTALLIVAAVSNFVSELLVEQEKQAKIKTQALDSAQRLVRLGSWDWDMQTDHLSWSDELYRIFDLQPQQLKASYEAYLKLIHPADRKRVNAIIKQAARDCKPFNFEHRIVLQNGSWRMLHSKGLVITDAAGKAVNMHGTAQDITEQSMIQEALRRRSEELQKEKLKLGTITQKDEALISSIGDSIVVTDEHGRITRVNAALESLIGFKEEELVGKNVLSAIPVKTPEGADVPQDQLAMFEALSTGNAAHATYQLIRKDKTKLIAEFTATPYLIAGKTIGVVDVIHDISQQSAIDKAKTEFVSLASHQLRTPLSTINWYLEMVLGGDAGKITAEQKKYLTEIYTANQRMVVLVNSLLNVSRIDLGTFAIEPVPIELQKTVENVIAELQGPIHAKKLKLTTNFADNLKPYIADPKLTHIIFQNLISNAVKYTPDRGKIAVSIETSKNDLIVSVADNGLGIPKTQQKKIFTKLFRADNVIASDTDGTGLGLYLVKAIVNEAGGKISFDSKENAGTTFTIILPIAGMKPREGTKGLNSVEPT